jgi:arabinogalactan oligomer/maltooligosaccharide transport system permease protein
LAYKIAKPYFLGIETLPGGGSQYARVEVKIKNIQYDKKADTFTNVLTKAIYKDDGKGNYRNVADKTDFLDPGWRQGVWFENFAKLFSEPKIREPLVQVFLWTIAFAVITVISQFALGLLVAIAMDKKIRGRNVYRSLMILPYAMPSIMSILIWGGMLDDNGAINTLLNTHINWLHDPTMAKVSVLLVNLWLGFPYFYLISSGSLQAIPKELSESASIDGANSRQIFRMITLPLLLRMLTPLLIASFAFNFNNFNIIYLLTGGGPSFSFGSIAGSTDILISYTYKLAFDTTVQDYGLASAISVVIFFIVAGISMYGIRKSKVLDDFA